MTYGERVALVAAIIAIVGVIGAIVYAFATARTCVVERYNCRPAIRASWDRGPVAYPDMKCDERCR